MGASLMPLIYILIATTDCLMGGGGEAEPGLSVKARTFPTFFGSGKEGRRVVIPQRLHSCVIFWFVCKHVLLLCCFCKSR